MRRILILTSVLALFAAPALAQTPSKMFGPNRADDECIQGIAATAGHDFWGANTVAGRPFDAERPHCNVVVSRDGKTVKNFTVTSLIGLFFVDKPKPTEQAAKPAAPVKETPKPTEQAAKPVEPVS